MKFSSDRPNPEPLEIRNIEILRLEILRLEGYDGVEMIQFVSSCQLYLCQIGTERQVWHRF